jgi:hypothetical protein
MNDEGKQLRSLPSELQTKIHGEVAYLPPCLSLTRQIYSVFKPHFSKINALCFSGEIKPHDDNGRINIWYGPIHDEKIEQIIQTELNRVLGCKFERRDTWTMHMNRLQSTKKTPHWRCAAQFLFYNGRLLNYPALGYINGVPFKIENDWIIIISKETLDFYTNHIPKKRRSNTLDLGPPQTMLKTSCMDDWLAGPDAHLR